MALGRPAGLDGGQMLPVSGGFTQVHAVLPQALSAQPADSLQFAGSECYDDLPSLLVAGVSRDEKSVPGAETRCGLVSD